MPGFSRTRCLIAAGLLGLAAGCGGSGGSPPATPEEALTALAEAINDNDDDAVDRLICSAGRDDSVGFDEARAALAEVDSRFEDLRYQAEAGPVTERTDTTATGTLRITVVGMPADLSVEAQQLLDTSEAPRPLNQGDETGRTHLIRQDGHWVACGPIGVR